MKLTSKDKAFLAQLKRLLDEKGLRIELKEDGSKRLILRQNYGDKIAYVQAVLMLSWRARIL